MPVTRHLVKPRSPLIVILASALFVVGCGYSHIADFEEPTLVTRLEIHDGQNKLLWRIDCKDHMPVPAVDYAVAPQGFVQVFPVAGPPRHLRGGEPLLLVYTTADRWTRHEGVAVGDSAFKGGGWLSGPLARKTPEDVFVATQMPISKLLE